MAMRVPRTDAFGGASFATSRLRLPFGPEEGLFVFDRLGEGAPLEVPLPASLVGRGTFPYVILSSFDGDTAFLAQRWVDRPVAAWQALGAARVSSASVCLTPYQVATRPSRDGLVEAARVVRSAPDLWAPLALEGGPLLGVRITQGNGAYPLSLACGASGEAVGWVLEFGLAETTDASAPRSR
jgi:hypothetical protein